MATEGHGFGRREDRKKKFNPGMDLEFNQIKAQIENLAFKMQQNAKAHWVYE
jgi:hypothetical protein